MLDPYKTLGVSKTATQDEIRKAYRKLARKYHPDMNQGKPEAEEKFKEVSQAYDLIGTEEKRQKFDRGETDAQNEAAWREQWARAQHQRGPYYYQTQGNGNGRYAFYGGFDDDILRSFFGDQVEEPEASPDQHFESEISFEDSVLGAERELTLPGRGRLKVKIPSGIKDGQTIKLRGQASPGAQNPGDVYITLRVRPSKHFTRTGFDLESDLPVALNEAVLGGEIKARVIDGHILVRIPPGANTGQRLRVRGKGVANPKTGERGDHYFNLKIVLPKEIDPDLKKAVQDWAQAHHYNPREMEAT